MRRRVLLCLALGILSACRGDDATRPNVTDASSPNKSISDGNHCAALSVGCTKGNPDFFFLPPMVREPRGTANWDAGTANPSLSATVEICRLPATKESDISEGTPCDGTYSFRATVGSRNISYGPLDDDDIDALKSFVTHYTSFGEPYYHLGWKVPAQKVGTSAPPVFYRIRVKVGAKELGYADVESVSNLKQLLNVHTGEFIPLTGGLRLPINFRIENRALCADPADKTASCATKAIDLSKGGSVETTLPNSTAPSGVLIPIQPAQPGAPPEPPRNITVEPCDNLNDRATDLPTFGSCIRVTAEPALPPAGLVVAATVFICDIGRAIVAAGVNEVQEKRLTMHRLDMEGEAQLLTALPHTVGCPEHHASAPSVKSFWAALTHGRMRAAAGDLASFLGPKPLYAARRIDLGGGGLTFDFSDFQYALPGRFQIDPTTNGRVAETGSLVEPPPTVTVLDVGGDPIKGARVRFFTSDGSVDRAQMVTGADGKASTSWTLGASANNQLRVFGRGIGGSDKNGPRIERDDPFQPIQIAFDGSEATSDPNYFKPVTVETGSVYFSATSLFQPINGFDFGSGGFVYTHVEEGGAPQGWFQPGYSTASWTGASAPFGSGSCAGPPATRWDVGTSILVRKSFSNRYAGTVSITAMIDNDMRVWLDGKDITTSGTSSRPDISLLQGSWWIHDYCAAEGPPTFTADISPGNHVLAIYGLDRGGDSHLDIKLSVPPPTHLVIAP